MDSIWQKTAEMPAFSPLDGDRNTEVLIIGGGMAGVLCAYFLDQAGVDYLLLEAGELGGGATQNTTAKLTVQHGLIYDKLLRRFGPNVPRLYWEANQAALQEFRRLAQDMDCDFQEQDSYVYALERRDKLEREIKALKMLNVPAELAEDLPLPFPTAGAVRLPGQAQFHPLKFLANIARGLHIHTQSKVLELRPGAAVTHHGTVRAKKIILATHFPILNKHGAYFLKLYQHRSYVLALEGTPEFPGMYVDESSRGLSFRHYNGTLLLGGGGHRTGKDGGGWTELSRFVRRVYPGARITGRWAAQDCMPLDSLPYIGPYSPKTPGLYAATGFQKWGMTSSMAAALLLRDLVRGKENPYAALFSPARSILHPQLAVNLMETMGSLLTPTRPRCPHLGCALKYNRQEHTWDCPCHGSRFSQEGRLLDGPAADDWKRVKGI